MTESMRPTRPRVGKSRRCEKKSCGEHAVQSPLVKICARGIEQASSWRTLASTRSKRAVPDAVGDERSASAYGNSRWNGSSTSGPTS